MKVLNLSDSCDTKFQRYFKHVFNDIFYLQYEKNWRTNNDLIMEEFHCKENYFRMKLTKYKGGRSLMIYFI